MSRQFNDEKEFTIWNEMMSNKYSPEDYHLNSSFIVQWVERQRVRKILQFLDCCPDDLLLEVGCGAGNILEALQTRYLYGVDLSITLLEKAQVRLAHHQAQLLQANGGTLPFRNQQFDKIICTEVLEHVPEPKQLIYEMARVAKQNAIIVISVPNEEWIRRAKMVANTIGISSWLLHYKTDGYSSDEWHIHDFDLRLLREVTANTLHIKAVAAIPNIITPLRYVACCSVL